MLSSLFNGSAGFHLSFSNKAESVSKLFFHVSFVGLTHFETDDKKRHLIADCICCALRVHSLTRVVFHRLTKATWSLHSVRAPLDEATVCLGACLKTNGASSHVIWPVAFAALNHQLLSETL